MAPTRVYKRDDGKWKLDYIVTYELVKFEFAFFVLNLGFGYVTSYEDDSVKVRKLLLPLMMFTRVYKKIIFNPE